MHPNVIYIKWDNEIKEALGKRKSMLSPFKLVFRSSIDDCTKATYINKGKIAMIVTFRCNGSLPSCNFVEKVSRVHGERRRVCTMMYEVKVMYNDLSTCKILVHNGHKLSEFN
jgi:hypothetical protein